MDNSQLQQSVDGDFLDNPPAPPIPGIEPGMKIANFELKKMLGRGGMGEVWLAYQPAMDRNVAIKLLSPMYVQDDNFVKRFLKEAKLSGKLEHPNIITAHDAGIDNGIYYLAMSFVDGDDLGYIIKQDRFIKEKQALEIGKKIAEALQYAWDSFKILHRDIKPSNIMLDANNSPKLMDMGISKAITEESSMTMTGAIVGTPHYISPEQARGEEDMDFRADIYSLGATLYNILTGDVPFKSMTTLGVLSKLISEPLPPPKVMNPQLSDGCAMVVEIMMAKDRNERQASWQEVIDDIDAVLNGGYPITPLPADAADHYQNIPTQSQVGHRPPISRSVILAAASCVLVILAAATILFIAVKRKKMKAKLAASKAPVNQQVKPLKSTAAIQVPKQTDPATVTTTQKQDQTEEPVTKREILENKPIQVATVSPTTKQSAKERQAKELWDLAKNFSQQALSKKNNFDVAIKQFEKMKKNFTATKYEMMADIEIERLRQGQEEAIAEVKAILDKKANRFIKQGNFYKAADVYNNYAGVFSNQTGTFRSEKAELCLTATAKYNILKNAVINKISTLNLPTEIELTPLQKKQLLDLEKFYGSEIKAINAYIKGINNACKAITNNMKSLQNKTVTIAVKQDNKLVEKQLTVTSIGYNELTGIIATNKKVTCKASDLSFNDFAKLCTPTEAPILYGILGVERYKNKQYKIANDYLAKAGFFSKHLLEFCESAEEQEAELFLKSALLKAGLAVNQFNKMNVLNALAKHQLKKQQAIILLRELNQFSSQYKNTALASKNKDVMTILKRAADESKKRVNLLGEEYENIEQRTEKTVLEGVNLFEDDMKKLDKKK